MIQGGLIRRKGTGVSPRTLNICLTVLRNVLRGGALRWNRAYAIVGLRSDWRHGTTRGNAQKKTPASRS